MSNDTIAITLASIVKNKSGLWVSEKQANFIRSQCYDKDCYVAFTTAKKPSTLFYYLDDIGVVRVEKTTATHKNTIEYDRNIDPNIAIRKRYLREIKQLENSIKERELHKNDYTDDSIEFKEILSLKIKELELKITKLDGNKEFFITEDLLDDFNMFHEKYNSELVSLKEELASVKSLFDTANEIDLERLSSLKLALNNI